MTSNPMSVPEIFIEIKIDKSIDHYNMLTVTEHRELNVPQDPCEEDPGYSFRSCVRESFSRRVGCRTQWDRWSDQGRKLCNDLESYR